MRNINAKNGIVREGNFCGFEISRCCVGSPAEYWMAKLGGRVYVRKVWSDLKRHLQAYTGKQS